MIYLEKMMSDCVGIFIAPNTREAKHISAQIDDLFLWLNTTRKLFMFILLENAFHTFQLMANLKVYYLKKMYDIFTMLLINIRTNVNLHS